MHKFTLAIYVILLYIVLRINAACKFWVRQYVYKE